MSYERRSAAAWAIHAGEILKNEFLMPMKISGYRLAKALDVTPQRVSDILVSVRRKAGLVGAGQRALVAAWYQRKENHD